MGLSIEFYAANPSVTPNKYEVQTKCVATPYPDWNFINRIQDITNKPLFDNYVRLDERQLKLMDDHLGKDRLWDILAEISAGKTVYVYCTY